MARPDEMDGGRLPVPLVPRAARWLAVAIVALAVAYLSLTSPARVPGGDTAGWMRSGHLLAYAVLSLTLAYAWASWETRPWIKASAVLGLALAYGGLIEGLQGLRPERTPDLVDLAIDALGATWGAVWSLLEARIDYRPL